MKINVAPMPLSDHPKLIRLSRGLLGTMRLLKSRGTSDSVSTGEMLAMQRFFREFDDWIKKLEHGEQVQNGLRATLRRRHMQHCYRQPKTDHLSG